MSRHISVLLDEVVEAFTWRDNNEEPTKRAFLDCTLGGGGHSEALLSLYPDAILIGLDQDAAALERSAGRLARFAPRVAYSRRNFRELGECAADLAALFPEHFQSGSPTFDGILADLGISSDQLDDPERGFSFHGDGPLDMRMDRSQTLTAAQVVNEYDERSLARVFSRGGMGGESRMVVREIIRRRPVSTVAQLSQICTDALLPLYRKKKRTGESDRIKNPSLVPFQAIRIEVNGELDAVDSLLESAPKLLRPGGRLAVISFHSLEDQHVTRRFRELSRGVQGSRRLPELHPPFGKLLTPQAIVPGKEEIEKNPRSRSARLRVFERAEG